ncbi:MAG TPA: NBR1-Ig-like domain-containing protein [Anaerolineales bacterium]|nr:NBR1-Ig-like domain-containing protein [Anaerolineales bacterium]
MKCKKYLLTFLLFSFLLSGCGNLFPTPPVFVPPTLAATSQAVQTPLPTSLPATPTPSCQNNLAYLDDLTLPDGTFVNPGESLDKRWQVENNGTCNWEEDYTLRVIAGPDMGATPEQPLYPARAGSEAVIRIIYIAPTESGIYRSAWQAFDPDGQPFGDPIFIEIIVP